MLLATQSTSIAGTMKYFDSVLTRGDYYLGQELAGHWRGEGARTLGLGEGAEVTKEAFAQLLQGRHPLTGEKLTQRLRKDRRPGMDLTFSAPKSVSLAWAMSGDEAIILALEEAVHETMHFDAEPLVARRVRTGRFAGTRQRATTGKLIYADFLHKTARPVDGIPDPHLHVHAFVMNWTEEGGKSYAAELEEIVRQRPSLQAKFESRLALKLEAMGYRPQRVQYQQSGRLKTGWELQGVERATIEKFSRRTAQVEEHALLHAIDDPAQKGRLGKLTREKKDEGRSIPELSALWRSRLTNAEQGAFASLRRENERGEEGREEGEITFIHTTQDASRRPPQAGREAPLTNLLNSDTETENSRAVASVQFALDHFLYRQSTVERHQLVGLALEHGLTLRPETVERVVADMGLIERRVDCEGGVRRLVTTRSVLEAERRLIAYARDGRGTRRALSDRSIAFKREWLGDQQKAAVEHVLRSRDSVMAILGGAGTGKTSLMQEAAEAIRGAGREVSVFAPSTGAREVLVEQGFDDAQTVEHLLRNTKLHPQLRDQVIWIDEAGLLDVRSMNAVFDIAREQNARVVLSGDTRQHASPRRGEAMRLLENEAGLKIARSETIRRQKGRYRQAVELVSKGYDLVCQRSGKTGLVAGFDLLDAMGKIHQIGAGDLHAQLADAYLRAEAKGKSTLVVAPTHAEGRSATEEIRARLQQRGRLSEEEQTLTRYRSLNLSEAEKGSPRSYAGCGPLIVQFHQNVRGFGQGERYRVAAANEDGVQLTSLEDGRQALLPLKAAERFEVYAEEELRLAAGDKIRFSLGGVTRDGKNRLSNGRLDEVKGFDRRGDLVLKNGWVVSRGYAHLDLGYVITSHASQGKDRDVAIAAMGAQSLPAINARQFYVTVSRGREDVLLFVDDKARVREAIQRSGRQLSATEMVRDVSKNKPHGAEAERTQRRRLSALRERVARWWRGIAGERATASSPRATSKERLRGSMMKGMDRTGGPA